MVDISKLDAFMHLLKIRIRGYESAVANHDWHHVCGPTRMMDEIPRRELTWVLEELEKIRGRSE